MSGERFDYKGQHLRDEIFSGSNAWSTVFENREIPELVCDELNLAHEVEWYDSAIQDTKEKLYKLCNAEAPK